MRCGLAFTGQVSVLKPCSRSKIASSRNMGTLLRQVPFGQLVGEESYRTLDAWYTGYGDIGAFGGKAPAQGKMYNRGLAYLKVQLESNDSSMKLCNALVFCFVSWDGALLCH